MPSLLVPSLLVPSLLLFSTILHESPPHGAIGHHPDHRGRHSGLIANVHVLPVRSSLFSGRSNRPSPIG
ncbi:hypothetical protein CA13_12220 [Planctomycetes bacterium CA13]|uniref:Uncharacterized protein n=1 Tax=Novipirellula herctigrandis TaxID=2527986 RepID=A0A5C5YXP7_9BACT|nr:hypothetical protein CA13_12220 [Planctomycetes bacterium CA13]